MLLSSFAPLVLRVKSNYCLYVSELKCQNWKCLITMAELNAKGNFD
jgi:hypothetical protein